jgi:methionine sulfoxide reductase heme-binding subunit
MEERYMTGTKFALQKWSIVGFTALLVGGMVGIILIIHGIDEESMRMIIRATGRTSLILFITAFIASSVRKLWSNNFTAWLLKNRRYFGVSMAVSHTYHAFAIYGLWLVTSGVAPKFEPVSIFGYVLLAAMTITSFDAPTAWLGKRNWLILHKTGMHFFWLGLLLEYASKLHKSIFIYSPFLLLLLLAMILRLIAGRTQKKIEGVG